MVRPTRVAIFMPAGVASGDIAQNYLLEPLSQAAATQLYRKDTMQWVGNRVMNDKGRYRQFHAGLRGPFLSGLAREPNSNAIINSILKFLFAPDVSLRCLDRRVP